MGPELFSLPVYSLSCFKVILKEKTTALQPMLPFPATVLAFFKQKWTLSRVFIQELLPTSVSFPLINLWLSRWQSFHTWNPSLPSSNLSSQPKHLSASYLVIICCQNLWKYLLAHILAYACTSLAGEPLTSSRCIWLPDISHRSHIQWLLVTLLSLGCKSQGWLPCCLACYCWFCRPGCPTSMWGQTWLVRTPLEAPNVTLFFTQRQKLHFALLTAKR